MVFCLKQAENRLLILRHHLNELILVVYSSVLLYWSCDYL